MGYEKNQAADEHDRVVQAWANKARAQDHRCETCGELIEYGDRVGFFETKRCARHAKNASGDG